MPPDNLVCAVSLDPLGARVPARDAAIEVEEEDRVIFDGRDQQTHARVALPQDLGDAARVERAVERGVLVGRMQRRPQPRIGHR